ncbi:hypothetical protein AB19_5237 [Escherichia coli 3-373-03_S1_C1]|nr:hypothetical protein [Escherichia coli]KDU34316.1 hypothetical protein AB19_5237 [Escherichia coli 3-373-03_S1_C1]
MTLPVFITVIADHDKPQPSGCLLEACQHLWPVADNGVYQQFTCVNPSDQPCSPAA